MAKTYEVNVSFTTLIEATDAEQAKAWVEADLEDFFVPTNQEVNVVKEVTEDV